jgi:hypothetical protein
MDGWMDRWMDQWIGGWLNRLTIRTKGAMGNHLPVILFGH